MLVDESAFPVVVINLDEASTLDEILDVLRALMQRSERVVVIADATRGIKASLGAPERKRAADFIKRESDLMREHFAGFATLHSSTLVRGVITAIRWVAPLPVPDDVFRLKKDALVWAAERLAAS